MGDGYQATCPFCHTQIRGPHGGAYREFVQAVKNLKTHWRFSCGSVPQMGRKEKDVIAEDSVKAVG